MKILMLCKGNICRSPMAEAILSHKVAKHGLAHNLFEDIQVDSAGTESYHVGENYDHRTISTLKAEGIDFNGVARKFEQADFDRYDWIFAADSENLRALSQKFDYSPERHIHVKHMTACSKFHANQAVTDPYYGTISDFKKVYDLLDESLSELFYALLNDELRGKHV